LLALTAGALQHRRQRIAAALAHQPAELAHDRGLRRLAPEYQAGDRNHDQQQGRDREDREVGNPGRAAQGFIAHETGNRVFDQIPDLREHLSAGRLLLLLLEKTRPEQP
jgi:hypothetical protein